MKRDWLVSLPLEELLALKNQEERLDALKAENVQLRRELDALRNMFSEVCMQFGDLKKEVRNRR